MSNRSRKARLAKKIAELVERELEPNENDQTYSLWDAILDRRTKRR